MTAENPRQLAVRGGPHPPPSMRPRPMTAENPIGSALPPPASPFNEAAADDRGKPASRCAPPWPRAGFNEAAADDRGKPDRVDLGADRLDGASMRPRPMTAENRRVLQLGGLGAAASMRPRPMTAENPRATSATTRPRAASMRPRPMTAENLRAPPLGAGRDGGLQ